MNQTTNLHGWENNKFTYQSYNPFPDKSLEFFLFLMQQYKLRDSTMDIGIKGLKRFGKTILGLVIYLILLLTDKTRHLFIYKSENLVKVLQNITNYIKNEALEKTYHLFDFTYKFSFLIQTFETRIHFCENLVEIDSYINQGIKPIIYIDEGAITANAKEALTKANRELEKAFKDSSHKDTILIINSQDEGFIASLRRNLAITIYKRVSEEYIDKCGIRWIQHKYHRRIFQRLNEKESIINGVHKQFTDKGWLEFNIFKLFPWFTKEFDEAISKNASNNSFSNLLEQDKRMQPKIDKISKEFVEFYDLPNEHLKKQSYKKEFTEWYKQQYGFNELYIIEPYIKNIDSKIAFIIFEKLNSNNQSSIVEIVSSNERKFTPIFPEFIASYAKSSFEQKVIRLFMNGFKEKHICVKCNCNKNKFTTYLQSFKSEIASLLQLYIQIILKDEEIPINYSFWHNGRKLSYEHSQKGLTIISIPNWINIPILIDETTTILHKSDIKHKKIDFSLSKYQQSKPLLYVPFPINEQTILQHYFTFISTNEKNIIKK